MPRPSQSWKRVALVLSVGVILLATLSPGQWTATEGRPRGLDARLADVLLNVALFVPFGAALGRLRRSASKALLAGTLLSIGVEVAQLWIPGRTSGLTDVVMNAIGTGIGWTVWRTSDVWAKPTPRLAGRLALAAALVASVTVAATGLLLAPAFPATPYFGHWAPEFGQLRVYGGQVLEAQVGDARIPSGLIRHFAEVRSRLVAGEPLRVVAVAGASRDGLAPIVSINDWRREILLLGLDGEDLVYRFQTRGIRLGLDSPELRVPAAVRGIDVDDRLTITVKPDRAGYCVDVNGSATCGVGFSAGTGWALLAYGQGIPPGFRGLLSMLWLAALALPIGYWARSRWPSGLALSVLAVAVLVVPEIVGLSPTPPTELVATLGAVLAGVQLRKLGGDAPLGRREKR